ncbi:MAG: biotin--[Clostridia bacterium]|nr:biotin--[acetyl-CoA-carboxylase] ligase [Clostridia bacterium]
MKRPNKALSPFWISVRTFPWCSIKIFDTVDSTNNWLKTNGQKHGQVVISRSQTGGKGTKGRSFFSPDGTGLYFSILFKEGLKKRHLDFLTCAAAVAVAEAIEIICGVDAKIKWVNDIYVDGKKAGGILTESQLSPDGKIEYCIVGIGINLFYPQNSFGELEDIAGSVLKKGRGFLFNSLTAEIINRLRLYFDDIENPYILEIYRQKSCILNRPILVTTSADEYVAFAKDIDFDGRLVITDANGCEQSLYSADISVKLKNDEA